MPVISNTLAVTDPANAASQEVLADINKALKAKGLTELTSTEGIEILSSGKNEDGTFSVSYSYTLPQPEKQTDGASARAAEALSSIDEDTFTDIFQVMILFHEIAMQQRDSAKEARHAELKVQIQSILDQAGEMRDSALATFIGGVAMGVLSIAGGFVSIAGALKSGSQIAKETKLSKEADILSGKATALSKEASALSAKADALSRNAKSPTELFEAHEAKLQASDLTKDAKSLTERASRANARATEMKQRVDGQIVTNKYQGWNSLLSGFGSISKSTGEYFSTQDNADGKEAEAKTVKSQAEREELTAYQEKMQQVLNDVRQVMQQITQNQAETVRSILRV